MPAPWLSRNQLMDWLKHQVQADAGIPDATRLELRAVLERLKAMDASNEKAIAGWKRLQEGAPKVWEATKPVRDALIAEGVKALLRSQGVPI